MLKTQRKRAVVLALIAFFCTAAITYVAVDWKHFGGGFLAFLRGKHEPVVAYGGGSPSGSGVGHLADGVSTHSNSPSLPQRVATARHPKVGADGSGGKSEEDLFKYGDSAAGGIPPGSFVVAQNEPQGGAEGGGGGGGATTSPAPAPSNGNPGDSGLPISGGSTGGKTPTPPTSPTPPTTSPPPPTTPVTPPPPTDPIQSGTSDTPMPPTDNTPPPSIPTPVSAVPEASNAAMMTLGALFFAAAAVARKRNNG